MYKYEYLQQPFLIEKHFPYFEAEFLDAGSGSALKSKFRVFRGIEWSLGGPWTFKMEVWRLKMEVWGGSLGQWSQVLVTLMRSRIRIRIEEKSWIRIRIEKKSCIRKKICEHLITNNMHVLTYI
jgi:hypothetical protein